MNSHIGLILILVVALIVLVFIKRKFKSLVVPNVYLISGRVKSGKTLLSVHLAIKQYRKAMFKYYIKCCIARMFFRDMPEKPMLYSNIPLAKVKHNPFTFDILFQKVRIPHGSVVLLDEASLLADSMLFNDKYVNNKLMRFVKLFAHYSHGGYLFIDTQAVADLHFSFRRCIGSYLYIENRTKLPFVSILSVREFMYADDKSVVNSVNEDAELSMRKVIIWNSSYKKYDSYCYSSFTDKKPLQVDYDVDIKSYKDNLKVYRLVSLQDFAKEINTYMEKEYPEEYSVYGYVGVYKNEKKKDN